MIYFCTFPTNHLPFVPWQGRMNDSADIPSIRGVLHQHQHREPVETATAQSYYDGQLYPAQIPRGIGDQLQPVRVDGNQGNTQSGYRGLTSGSHIDGAEQSKTYDPETRELGQAGIKEPLGGFPDSRQELPHGGVYASSDYMRQGQYAEDRQQIKSEQSVSDMRVNGSSTSPLANSSQTISGQKRNAVGEIKVLSADTASPGHGVDGPAGYRSRSISSASHESRIAVLSVQLRTRLSHAAAKVEKNRQSQDLRSKSPLRGANPALSSTSPVDNGKQLDVGIGFDDCPDGTTASALNRSATYSFHPSNGPPRFPETSPSFSKPHSIQPTSQYSPRKLQQPPKLAPPVDIVSGWGSGRRRRPNPNEWIQPPRISPPSRHRRHHSQLELGSSKPYSGHESHPIPGTLSLRPSHEYPTSTPYNGYTRPPTDSQESSMEQDAIETLLFMSSPENSGYRSNTRQRHNTISNSIDSSMGSGSSSTSNPNPCLNPHMNMHYNTGASALESHDQSRHSGLEVHAGDEIDRMLDQMGDSDSEDEERSTSVHSRSHTVAGHPRRCNGLSGS